MVPLENGGKVTGQIFKGNSTQPTIKCVKIINTASCSCSSEEYDYPFTVNFTWNLVFLMCKSIFLYSDFLFFLHLLFCLYAAILNCYDPTCQMEINTTFHVSATAFVICYALQVTQVIIIALTIMLFLKHKVTKEKQYGATKRARGNFSSSKI